MQGTGIWGVRTSPVWLGEGGPSILGLILEAIGSQRWYKSRREMPGCHTENRLVRFKPSLETSGYDMMELG